MVEDVTTDRTESFVYGLKRPLTQYLTPVQGTKPPISTLTDMNLNSSIPFMDVSPVRRLITGSACISLSLLLLQTASAADFTVTTPGGAFAFTINGLQPNPTLTLVRGKTYTFDVSTSSSHPFWIKSAGVQNNITTQGTLTYTVPNVASNYTYICLNHSFMVGQILTVPAPTPPPPPMVQILSVEVGSNIVVRSTGTNTWSVNPQYSTDLASTNWFALTVLTNVFSSGTNETICGRPPGDNVFIRIQSSPN
jgi:hypothetical protein